MATRYKDIDHDLGASQFEIEPGRMKLWFVKTARPYTYNYASVGQANTENMKRLALPGDGLNGYIKNNTTTLYVR